MFFLANLYERRLNENMRRHVLSANLAPAKPRLTSASRHHHGSRRSSASPNEHTKADEEILGRFLGESNGKNAVEVSPPPPAYVAPTFLAPKSVGFGKSIPSETKGRGVAFPECGRARAGSVESAAFTDSDATSNSSFSA